MSFTTADSTQNDSPVPVPATRTIYKVKLDLLNLLKSAGAQKETFTFKEVLYYLGEYIMDKRLYDEKQQYIVRCSSDPLGDVFGVQSFNVKEPGTLYPLIFRNLITVHSQDSAEATTSGYGSRVSRQQNNEQCDVSESIDLRPAIRNIIAEILQLLPPQNSSLEELLASDSEEIPSSSDCESQLRTSCQRTNPCEADEEPSGTSASEQQPSGNMSLSCHERIKWWLLNTFPRKRTSSGSSDFIVNDFDTYMRSVYDDWVESASDSDRFSLEYEVASDNSGAYSLSEDGQVQNAEVDEDDDHTEEVEGSSCRDSFSDNISIASWKCSECDEVNPPLIPQCCLCFSINKTLSPVKKFVHPLRMNESDDSDDDDNDGPDRKKVKLPDSEGKEEGEAAHSSESQKTDDCSHPSTSGGTDSSNQAKENDKSTQEACLICQSRPKNGCIVHGDTGHLMSCYTCAKKLKKRNKPCPVCRQPIQMVVRTYVS